MTDRTATIKERQRKHWNSVAPGWSVWLNWTRRNFQPLTAWFQSRLGWAAGARVLDVGCGAGYPAIDAALSVRPGGRVVAIDLSSDMIARASQNAAARSIDNVEWTEMDAEALQLADASFDIVQNADGLMFCPNPERAVAEVARVLAPGGRVGVVVWDEPAKNPFLMLIREAAPDILTLPEPPADEPHPFRLASADALRSLTQDGRVRLLSTSLCASATKHS